MDARVGGVADSIESSRAEARARIPALDSEISDLERSLSSRRHEREALQHQLDSYTYPVLTLPYEIISEIFTHFIPVYPTSPPLVGLLSPFTLGQICHAWREIAVSTPSLWRAIGLEIGGMDQATQLQVLENFLDRSKMSSLSITLEYEESDEADLAIQPILAALSAHSHRWEEMDLSLPFSDIVSLSSQRTPYLRTLTVGPSDDLDRTNPIMLFDQAPNLTTVKLRPDFDPFFLGLPWSQITTLNGMCHFEEEMLEILRLAVNLVHCSAALIDSADGANMPIAPHMHLQDLTFTPALPSDPPIEMRIFNQLTLPKLRRLQIVESWFGPNPRAAIAAWILRCGCDLEQLHIIHSKESELYYRKALPSVRKISTDYVPGNTVD
ncbi:hypothetical protein DFH09DRAFT_1046912 [Mycena vulgaris]|nr:hypothetical protein DFH09DRAFT_1046912 [Mycena vulgaris]